MFSAKGRIRPLTDTLKMCMMKPLRVAAGLGNPPNKWHNQGTEALHHVMKEEAHGQSIDQATIHENVNQRVVQQQNSEFKKAVYGMGEHRLAPGYENLSIDPLRWSQMTREQRSAYIKKVLGQGLLDDKNPDDIELKKLSISLEESGLPKQLASQVVADIFRKAEIILARFKVIPLDNGNFCVTESNKAFTVENIRREISNAKIVLPLWHLGGSAAFHCRGRNRSELKAAHPKLCAAKRPRVSARFQEYPQRCWRKVSPEEASPR